MNEQDTDSDYTPIAYREGPFAEYLFDIQLLLREAHILKKLHTQLQENCHNRPFQQIQQEFDCKDALLGGLTAKGEYKQDSYAKLIRQLFGVQFKNTEEAIARARADTTIDTEVVVNETKMIELIDSVIDHGSSITESTQDVTDDWPSQSEELPDPEGWKSSTDQSELISLIENPEDLSERLQAFLEAALQFLPNHDKWALFIWTLDMTPRYYLESAYPEFSDSEQEGIEDADDLWEDLKNLFGLEEQFHPETNSDDEQLKHDFTIYSYQSGSIGDHFLEIYSTLWELLESNEQDEESTSIREGFEVIIPELPDPKSAFQSKAEKSLQDLSDWDRPEDLENLRVVDTTEEELEEYKSEHKRRKKNNYSTFRSIRTTTKAKYQISELTLSTCEYHTWGQTGSGNTTGSHGIERENISLQLLNVLQDLAPSLFLLHGIEYRLEIDADHMTVVKL